MSARKRLAWQHLADRLFTGLCALGAGLALLPLCSLLWLVVRRGAPVLSLDLLTKLPGSAGEPLGGVGHAIAGTLLMVGLACVIGLPAGIGAGVFLAERERHPVAEVVRFLAEVLAGVPSIVVGIAGYGLVVVWSKHFSALAGALSLAFLMVPPLARGTEEVVRMVPSALREAALALGVPEWVASLRVVLRTARGSIATVALLAISRAAGETAPLLFTALSNQYWNLDPTQPTASLTVQIFNDATSPYDEWHQRAWGAALVLLLLVGGLNLLARRLAAASPTGVRMERR